MTDKRTAAKTRKPTKTDNADSVAVVPALAMAKVFGLASYTGCDKFRGERHDEINAHSHTLLVQEMSVANSVRLRRSCGRTKIKQNGRVRRRLTKTLTGRSK
jgi:hypothetical protein